MSDTATRIADAARLILRQEGAAAVSMRRVATVVGVTPMAIYRHYPNREALLEAITDSTFDLLVERWKARGGVHNGVEASLHDALDAFLDFAIAEPNLYRYLFTERRAGARTYPDDFRDGSSPTLTILAGLISDGMREGRLRAGDEWDTAFTVAAHIQGLILLYHGGRTGESAERFRAMCHESLERLLHGLVA